MSHQTTSLLKNQYKTISKRKKVTAVHEKGKDGKLADAFFLESCQEVAKIHPNMTYNEICVDDCCLQLVEKPERFNVIVTPNIYGNLIANVAAGVAGGGNGEIILFSSVMMLRHLQLPLFADRLKTAMTRVISEGKFGNSNTSTQEVVDAVIANLD